MPKVTFKNIDRVCEGRLGESILDIAINNDVPLQHACGGFCACTTCHVIVRSADHQRALSEMEEEEMDRLELVSERQDTSRLGCQTKVFEDVIVEIVNQDDF